MTNSKMLAPTAAFNRFLYAGVGDDQNGMELTLLSALARQNVDPWQKAADLSRLPGGAAILTLENLLESMPGHESAVERSALAGRLLSLLPNPAEIQGRDASLPHTPPLLERSAHTSELPWVLLYFIAMVVCGWWFSDHTSAEVAAQPVTASAPVAAESTPISR